VSASRRKFASERCSTIAATSATSLDLLELVAESDCTADLIALCIESRAQQLCGAWRHDRVDDERVAITGEPAHDLCHVVEAVGESP
jgi:hypothetical protein